MRDFFRRRWLQLKKIPDHGDLFYFFARGRRRNNDRKNRPRDGRTTRIEPLEERRLLTISTIDTVAGDYALGGGYSGDGGTATSAQLFGPNAVAVDSSGDLFIADSENGTIREVLASSGDIITIASGLDYPQRVAVVARAEIFNYQMR